MSEFKTRFDYLGLSTESKPSAKAVNGSTFKEVDTSKDYIFYKNNWYEKIKSGGGGDVSLYFKASISGGTQYLPGLTSMILSIPDSTTVSGTSLNYAFYGYENITTIPLIDTSSVISMQNMFEGCQKLTSVPKFDTSKVTNMTRMFSECYALTSIPDFDTSSVTTFNVMFRMCSNLKTIPVLNTSKATSLINMFINCSALSNESLNNILAMCVNATSYTGTKTLANLGLTSTQATVCEGLSNYEDFLEAGWTTGF